MSQSGMSLSFKDDNKDRTAAMFHTGGTTGTPKLAQHTLNGMLYQGWVTNVVLTIGARRTSVYVAAIISCLCRLP